MSEQAALGATGDCALLLRVSGEGKGDAALSGVRIKTSWKRGSGVKHCISKLL